jgi:predicted transcriptional regulator
MDRALKKVCIDLPDYIVEFLDELARLLGKEKSQLLTQILHPIYEAWRAGREASLRIELAEVKQGQVKVLGQLDVSNIVNEFVKVEGDKKYIEGNRGLVEDFVRWIQSKGIQLEQVDVDTVEIFLRETRAKTTKNTFNFYKYVLKKFVIFVRTRLKEV